MRRLIGLILPVVLVASSAWAGELKQEQVSAGAKAVIHVDVEGLIKSQVGQFAVKQLAPANLDAKLKAFASVFGFDPLKDVKGITVYAEKFDQASAVILIQATMDQAKVATQLAANDGYKEGKHGDVKTYQWIDQNDKKVKFGTFYGKDLAVVAGSQEALELAIDVLDKKDGPKPAVLKGLPAAPAGTLLVAAGEGFPVPTDAGSAIVGKARSASVVAGEADGKVFVKVNVTMDEARLADDLRKMADGLLAFVDLVGDTLKSEAAAKPQDAEAAVKAQAIQMLKGVKLAVTDSTISVEGSWTVDQVTTLLEKGKKAEEAKPAHPRAKSGVLERADGGPENVAPSHQPPAADGKK